MSETVKDTAWKDRLEEHFRVFSVLSEDTYIFLCDLAHDYSIWSRNVVDAFGLSGTHLHQASVEWEEHVHPDDREAYHISIERIFSGEVDSHDMQYRSRNREGHYDMLTCRGFVMRDDAGRPKYFGGSIRNHEVSSTIDNLTGLMNREGFFTALRNLIDNHEESVIMMLGISNFSEVNSLYGYEFGNRVIQKLARHCSDELANMGDYYRLDGTQSILISHNSSVEELKQKYEELRRYAAEEVIVEGNEIPLRLNGSLMKLDQFDIDDKTVFVCLNTAFQESKRVRMGDLICFNEQNPGDGTNALRKINAIRLSQSGDFEGFALFYQPIVDAKSERITGAEALLRWRNDEFGYVPPDVFMPVLENDSRFCSLGNWILRRSMLDGLAMVRKYPDFMLHVNIAYPQIQHHSFVTDVLNLLQETGYPAENFCLELTERCRLADPKLLRNTVIRLKSHGLNFAMDDFGTGYSSVNVLSGLDFDVIKIDKSFVKNIVTDITEQKLLRNFADLADIYDSEICVEGIESEEMRKWCLASDVTHLQGYHYSKPLPYQEFCTKYNIEN